MRSFLVSLFAALAALGVVALIVVMIRRAVRMATAPVVYRRSAPYRVNGRGEFRVLGIANNEDIEAFLRFLHRKFAARVLDNDIDPDDMLWKVGRRRDFIELRYADHLGARVRAGDKRGKGLYAKLLAELAS